MPDKPVKKTPESEVKKEARERIAAATAGMEKAHSREQRMALRQDIQEQKAYLESHRGRAAHLNILVEASQSPNYHGRFKGKLRSVRAADIYFEQAKTNKQTRDDLVAMLGEARMGETNEKRKKPYDNLAYQIEGFGGGHVPPLSKRQQEIGKKRTQAYNVKTQAQRAEHELHKAGYFQKGAKPYPGSEEEATVRGLPSPAQEKRSREAAAKVKGQQRSETIKKVAIQTVQQQQQARTIKQAVKRPAHHAVKVTPTSVRKIKARIPKLRKGNVKLAVPSSRIPATPRLRKTLGK